MTSNPHVAGAWPRPRLLSVYFVVLILLLYLPLAVLLLFSFNAGTSLSLPLQGLTTPLV